MNKVATFLYYIKDYLRHGEYSYIFSAIRYTLFGVPARKSGVIKTGLGKFLNRKGSIDFVFANYAYEWNVKKFMLEHLSSHDVFLDIGANIGTYSVMMAKKGLKCFVFEPIRENYEALQVNCKLNKLQQQMRTFNYGLGNREKTAVFIFDPVNTGASHIQEKGEGGQVQQVQIKRLDEVYSGFHLEKKDKLLIKIDVEGMEIEVLEGARNFLGTFSDILLVIESKHCGADKLKEALNKIASFEFIEIDDMNFAARKLKN